MLFRCELLGLAYFPNRLSVLAETQVSRACSSTQDKPFFWAKGLEGMIKNGTPNSIGLSKTQQRVFDYMTDFGSITTLQAFMDLGESRLSARIFELRKKSLRINGETILVENRYGEPKHVTRYYIG